MYSYEIQDYLKNRSSKLTLEEYYGILNTSPQICYARLVMITDFFHIKVVKTNDGYEWGITILSYNVDSSRINDINY